MNEVHHSDLLNHRLSEVFCVHWQRTFINRLWLVCLWQDAVGSTNQLAAAGSGGAENGLLAPPHNAYSHHGERARAMSASGKVTHTHTHILYVIVY